MGQLSIELVAEWLAMAGWWLACPGPASRLAQAPVSAPRQKILKSRRPDSQFMSLAT